MPKQSHLSLPGCYATSYNSCTKEQLVDLVEAGFEPEILDNPDLLFDVSVEEWYTVTGPANFDMAVFCLDQHKKKMVYFDA